jgi:hypothetical protein
MTQARFLCSVAFVGACLGVTPAFAQTVALDLATRNTQIRGEVPRACTITGPALAISASNATFAVSGVGSATITISQLVDPNIGDGTPQAATLQFEIPATCTVSHELNVDSANDGLALGGSLGTAVTDGFRNALPYAITTSWSTLNLSGQTTSGPLIGRVGDAATGNIVVSISIPAGGTPLVAGSYSDSLSINLSPTL